jgi:hypothetical protein
LIDSQSKSLKPLRPSVRPSSSLSIATYVKNPTERKRL